MSRQDRARARFLLSAIDWRRRVLTASTTHRLDLAACYARMMARKPSYTIRSNTWQSAASERAA